MHMWLSINDSNIFEATAGYSSEYCQKDQNGISNTLFIGGVDETPGLIKFAKLNNMQQVIYWIYLLTALFASTLVNIKLHSDLVQY